MANSGAMPMPRPGLAGYWDRLVGPGMTTGELALVLGASVLGGIWAAWRLADTGHIPLLIMLGAMIGFDTIGGAVCNTTWTTKRWYFRAGQGWRHHVAFVMPHLLYLAIGWWLFGFSVALIAVLGIGVVGGMIAILAAPAEVRLPVATSVFLAAMCAVLIVGSGTAAGSWGFEWFAPALLMKLLIGHLVPPEAT